MHSVVIHPNDARWNVMWCDIYDWIWSLPYIESARRLTEIIDSRGAQHDNGRIRQCLETQISFLIHAICLNSLVEIFGGTRDGNNYKLHILNHVELKIQSYKSKFKFWIIDVIGIENFRCHVNILYIDWNQSTASCQFSNFITFLIGKRQQSEADDSGRFDWMMKQDGRRYLWHSGWQMVAILGSCPVSPEMVTW